MADPFEAQLLSRLSKISHVLLVLSGKGGVGKSSVSVQLALSLLAASPNAKIGLLDIDLTGPSLPRMLGLEGQDVHSSEDGWVPVYLDARGPTSLNNSEQNSSQTQSEATGTDSTTQQSSTVLSSSSTSSNSAPASIGNHSGVLACMSIGFLLKNSSESVVWRGPKKNAMIKQFLGQVSWGELDYLIVDTPPGTSDEHISLLETLRPLLLPHPPSVRLPTLSSLLVSTPQALALLDVSKELSFVRRTQLPLLGLIENMSGYVCPHCGDIVGVFGQGGGEDFCRKEEERKDSQKEGEGGGCKFLGRVPIDRELVSLLDDVKEKGVALATGDDEVTVQVGDTAAGHPKRKTLLQRYSEIPSAPIVRGIAATVIELIANQKPVTA